MTVQFAIDFAAGLTAQSVELKVILEVVRIIIVGGPSCVAFGKERGKLSRSCHWMFSQVYQGRANPAN